MAKKNPCLVCQLTPSSFQICKEVQKSCCGRGWDDDLFWRNAQNIFFQLPKLNKFCLGVELDSANQVIKKLKMDPKAVSHFMPQQLQNVIKNKKNKKGTPVTEILNTCT